MRLGKRSAFEGAFCGLGTPERAVAKHAFCNYRYRSGSFFLEGILRQLERGCHRVFRCSLRNVALSGEGVKRLTP